MPTTTPVPLLTEYGTYEEELMGFDPNAIVAHAGGGQASATALTYRYNTVTTCATDYDSVKLILSKQGYSQIVFNDTAHTLTIYPVSGENINGIANNPVNIAAGESALFICTIDGEWLYSPSALGLELSGSLSVTAAQIKALFTSPQVLVPAIVGYYCQLQSYAVDFDYNAPAYSGGSGMIIITDTATQEQGTIPGIDLTTSYFKNWNSKFNSNGGDLLTNRALLLKWGGSNPINGNGVVKVYFTYRVFKP